MTVADKLAERVLVVPAALFREAGAFQGFSPDVGRYLPRLLDPAHLSYRPRSEVETDPSFKQLIPYVVLRCGEQVFHYTRGQRGTEARLRALRSVGVGGHISQDDSTLFGDPYREGMLREVAEEVYLESEYSGALRRPHQRRQQRRGTGPSGDRPRLRIGGAAGAAARAGADAIGVRAAGGAAGAARRVRDVVAVRAGRDLNC